MTRNQRLSRLGVSLLFVAMLAACGGGSSGSGSSGSGSASTPGSTSSAAGGRPTTTAQLEIVQPTPNQVTDANTKIVFKLTGAKFAAQTTKNVKPDEGYIHLSLDDRQLEVVDSPEVPLFDVPPGPHVVEGVFVASDHLPFANQPSASVSFTVK
jgi:hypothetical protein